jgi:hypothetical protein
MIDDRFGVMWRMFSIALVAGATPVALAALPDPVTFSSPKATVVFQHPDKFTDIKDMNDASDKGELGMLGILGQEILRTADDLVPAGDHLTMTFTDVKYAGQLPLMSELDETRILRGRFPPHYKFSYQVTNSSGQVIKQGNVDLLDIDYPLKMSRADDPGPLRVDKVEIDDWLTSNIKRLK